VCVCVRFLCCVVNTLVFGMLGCVYVCDYMCCVCVFHGLSVCEGMYA